ECATSWLNSTITVPVSVRHCGSYAETYSRCKTLEPHKNEWATLSDLALLPRRGEVAISCVVQGASRALLLTDEMHQGGGSAVRVPEALTIRVGHGWRDDVRLPRPGPKADRPEDLLIGGPRGPVNIKFHRLGPQAQRGVNRGPLAEGRVHQAERMPVALIIKEGLRRLVGVEVTRHEALAWFQIIVDRLHHLAQVLPALGIV